VQLLVEPDEPQRVGVGRPSSFAVNTSGGVWLDEQRRAGVDYGRAGERNGTTTINFTVAANPDPTPRTANITIGGQTFMVSQAAAPRAASR
jgi:hypothetical protein